MDASAALPVRGWTSEEARERLARFGPDRPSRPRTALPLALLISPLSPVLVGAAIVSAVLGDPSGAGIIIV